MESLENHPSSHSGCCWSCHIHRLLQTHPSRPTYSGKYLPAKNRIDQLFRHCHSRDDRKLPPIWKFPIPPLSIAKLTSSPSFVRPAILPPLLSPSILPSRSIPLTNHVGRRSLPTNPNGSTQFHHRRPPDHPHRPLPLGHLRRLGPHDARTRASQPPENPHPNVGLDPVEPAVRARTWHLTSGHESGGAKQRLQRRPALRRGLVFLLPRARPEHWRCHRRRHFPERDAAPSVGLRGPCRARG